MHNKKNKSFYIDECAVELFKQLYMFELEKSFVDKIIYGKSELKPIGLLHGSKGTNEKGGAHAI